MLKLNKGLLFIVLVAVECGLAMAYGDHPPYRDARVERATREYVAHPTPENKEAERDRVYAPGRKWNRIVMSLLIVNSCLTAAVGYSLVRKKRAGMRAGAILVLNCGDSVRLRMR